MGGVGGRRWEPGKRPPAAVTRESGRSQDATRAAQVQNTADSQRAKLKISH